MRPSRWFQILFLAVCLSSCVVISSGPSSLVPSETFLPSPALPTAFPSSTTTAESTSLLEPTATAIPIPTPLATLVAGPAGLSIEINTLQAITGSEPLTFLPVQGTQAEIEARHQDIRNQNLPRRVDAANRLLAPFGYLIDAHFSTQPGESDTYQLLKNGVAAIPQTLFDFSQVWVRQDGSDFWLLLSATEGIYLMRNNTLEKWSGPLNLGIMGNDLISIDEGAGLGTEVKRGDQILLNTTGQLPIPVPMFGDLWSDGRHWAVEIYHLNPENPYTGQNEVFIDGQSQNRLYGCQQSFGLTMMNGQAFYFFQQHGQIGISYAGQAIHLDFDEVYHGRCCSAGEFNPQQYDRMVDFFARKGQTWYFVEAELK